MVSRGGTIVPDTHPTVGQVGDDESECTSWDIKVREDCGDDVVVYPVERLAEVYHAGHDSSLLLVACVQFLLNEIQHEY